MRIENRYGELREVTVHLVAVDIAQMLTREGRVPQGFSLMEMEHDDDTGIVRLRFRKEELKPSVDGEA